MKCFNKTIIALAVTVASSQVMAAGFQLNSQSTTGIGRAFSGDAVIADNATVLSRNPAAMALFDKKQFSIGFAYADTKVNVKDVNIDALTGKLDYGSVDNAADGKFIPNIYYIQPINNQWAFGVAIFSNFGTGTDVGDLSNPVKLPVTGVDVPAPVDLLGNTELTTINFNTSVSYRLNDQLSLGAGLDIVYGQGKLARSGDLPLGTGSSYIPIDLVDVDADGVALGGIIGAVYELNANNRFGISYRFSPDVKADGDISIFDSTAKKKVNFDKIKIPLPDIFQVAGFHQLNDQFAVHYTAQLTTWGDFHQITLENGKLPDGTSVNDQPLKTYAWKDSWLFSVGGTYTLTDNWTLRTGFMFDQGVVGNISSISIPDSDRNWYTAGASYRLSIHSSIDLGIAYVRGRDVKLVEYSKVTGDIPGSGTDKVNATTDASATYYSLQYNYSF